MRRSQPFVVLIVVALLLAMHPILACHCSITEKGGTCPVCAFGTVRIVAAPALAAPIVLAYTITAQVVISPLAEVARTISSRGPPPSA